MKIGIMGAGKIAHTMAKTILGMKNDDIILEAIGSRTITKAKEFQSLYGIPKAYGSYQELVQDKDIDLIYVATPHSEHYDNAMLCLENKKNILMEKPFTVNKKEAEAIFKEAKKEGLFVTEAIWTRYMPSTRFLTHIIDSKIIGEVNSVQVNLGYKLTDIERLINPNLAGGALLDVGIYPLTFATLVFNSMPNFVDGECVKYETGVDASESVVLKFNNKLASLHSTLLSKTDRHGYIYGSEGYLEVDNINNPMKINHYNNQYELVEVVDFEPQITGFEYEVNACYNALKQNLLECKECPHATTIKMMEIMDSLRNKWEIKYPFEK